jgi:anti-anti-sigma factor
MPERSSFTTRVGRAGPDAEVIIRGELDLGVLPALSQELARLRDTTLGALTIDLAGVDFIDCACARAIIETCQDWPGPDQAVIRAASPIVRRVFQLVGLTTAAGTDGPGRMERGMGKPDRTAAPAPPTTNGADPGRNGVVDGPDLDRIRLVSAGGEHAG